MTADRKTWEHFRAELDGEVVAASRPVKLVWPAVDTRFGSITAARLTYANGILNDLLTPAPARARPAVGMIVRFVRTPKSLDECLALHAEAGLRPSDAWELLALFAGVPDGETLTHTFAVASVYHSDGVPVVPYAVTKPGRNSRQLCVLHYASGHEPGDSFLAFDKDS